MDNSDLNDKYFLDENAFNCPFCGLKNATYTIVAVLHYNHTKEIKNKAIFVKCDRCEKISLHFASMNLELTKFNDHYIGMYHYGCLAAKEFGFKIENTEDIDSKIFHSIPSSLFSVDDRIPNNLRELFTEAQECRKANLKTGASACIRKLIYTLLNDRLNQIAGNNPKKSLKDMGYRDYDECLSALKEEYKEKNSDLDIYFEQIRSIKGITSDQLHEDSWAEMSNKDLDLCLLAIKDLLYEIYVKPQISEERKKKLIEMQNKALKKETTT